MIFFLNSSNRVYNDKEINKVPQILFSNGVFNTTQATKKLWDSLGDFFVEASGVDMNITAKAGSASVQVTSGGKIQRVIIEEANALVATISANPDLANRNDAVILRIDQDIITADGLNTEGSNAVSLAIISGNSATPLTDAEISVALSGDPYIRLANILVPIGATSINQTKVTDVRSLVKMTRATKLAGDALRLYALQEDPSSLEKGDIWYNEIDGILKFYNGENTIALQTQNFDWGYYPPNGKDNNIKNFTPVAENDGTIEDTQLEWVVYSQDPVATAMALQIIKMPNITKPFVQIKMPDYPHLPDINMSMWTVDGSNNPVAQIEEFNFPLGLIPKDDYISIFLNQTYVAGVNYALVIKSTLIGNFNNGSNVDDYQMYMFARTNAKNGIATPSPYLLGTRYKSQGVQTTSVLALTWSTATYSAKNFIIRLGSRDELPFSETDITTNIHRIAQPFVAKSKDLTGFIISKGDNIGIPTGEINLSLYRANELGQPEGNIMATAVKTNAEWIGVSGTEIEFTLASSNLVVGNRYVVVIDTENYSDTNSYTLIFGEYADGSAKAFNTADGWFNLNGDIFFATKTSTVRKIVVTNDQGQIPSELIPSIATQPVYQHQVRIAVDGAPSQNIFPSVNLTTISSDGLTIVSLNSGGNLNKYIKDIVTGLWTYQGFFSSGITPAFSSGLSSIFIVGQYLYHMGFSTPNIVLYRYDLNNLTTAPVQMTFAVVVPWTSGSTLAWTDGTFIYLYRSVTGVTQKYSILGTTITLVDSQVSHVDMAGIVTGTYKVLGGFYYNGNVYFYKYDTSAKTIYMYRLGDLYAVAYSIIINARYWLASSVAIIPSNDSRFWYFANRLIDYGAGTTIVNVSVVFTPVIK